MTAAPRRRSEGPWFLGGLALLAGLYVLLILGMLIANASYSSWEELSNALSSEPILYALQLSLLSATLATLLSLWVAIPAGYLLSRFEFPGKRMLDVVFDIPLVLPPLVVGLSLLILFQSALGRAFEEHLIPTTYEIPSVVLAQFVVACAFSIRTMRVCFDQIDARPEQVARVLGCSRAQAFSRIALPQARRGIVAAATLAWARALGEFGPILVFSGATRLKTEVLPTTVFLELSIGNLEAATAVSLVMVALAVAVLLLARSFGFRGGLAV